MAENSSQEIVTQVFNGLRDHFVSQKKELNDLILLNSLVNQIKARNDFVLGAFLSWESADANEPTAINISGDEVLFFPDTTGDEFKKTAKKTLADIKKDQLFVSLLLHKQNNKRSRQIDLIHSCDVKTCSNKGQAHSGACAANSEDEWYGMSLLCELPNEFSSNTKDQTSAEKYASTVTAYFPKPENRYVIVYCPFLVPDGKPPGNFFGIYECNGSCSDDLLSHLSAIQHAGTLIYARRAITNALGSKFALLEKPLNELRSLREQMANVSGAISQIEAVMNPYYLFTANSELEKLNTSLDPFFTAHHELNEPKLKNEEYGVFFKIWAEHRSDIEKELNKFDKNLYKNYFGIFDDEENSKKIVVLYQAKALHKKKSPCCWIMGDKSKDENYTQMVNLDNKVPPLVFNLALLVLKEKHKTILEPTVINNLLILDINISADSKADGLDHLSKAVIEKLTKSVSSLSNGQTSTALALIIKASNEADNISNIMKIQNNNILEMTLTFMVVPIQ